MWNLIWDQWLQHWKVVRPNVLCIQQTRIDVRFWFSPFNLWPLSKCMKSVKNNLTFYSNGRGDRSLISTSLESWRRNIFLENIYCFLFQPSSGGGTKARESKLDQMCKLTFLKDFSNTVFLDLNINSSENISKISPLPKLTMSWLLNRVTKLRSFLTWQPQILYSWNLPRLCVFIRSFIYQKIGVSLIGCKRV